MNKIRAIRIEKGWSQKRLANAINSSEATIFRWEKGITSPSLNDLEKIADALGVHMAELLNPTNRRRPRAGLLSKSSGTAA